MIGSFFSSVSAGDATKCALQPFDNLFKGMEFFGYFIVVGESDDLGDEDIQSFYCSCRLSLVVKFKRSLLKIVRAAWKILFHSNCKLIL